MPSMSSSITTGTCACGSGVSVATATIQIVLGMQQRFADGGAVDFELGMRMALEAFDDHKIDRADFRKHVGERRLGLRAQFVHQSPAPARDDRNLGGAGRAVQQGILAGLVDIELMMRVLDGRDLEPAPHQHGITFVTSVVLPEPLQPARPMMRMRR